ncbi:FtsX-like permease family protein [Fulvivirga sp. M361]|uniref:ABC transporter permease n=1 Tax=Fulvivirga sp. M361 TaxID=2594266 RepID=UPI00117B04D6|nr:FtsX-like permease family protein [Fulvivirga sp. M361]TRX52056.1 FtsX-like permease family protein [Fulvivirga sp. M361]
MAVIFIACIGLLGLSSFVTQRRLKEIGVRKVLGGSVGSILFLFLKDFGKWILIALVLGCPLAILVVRTWLQNLSYRTDISAWILF